MGWRYCVWYGTKKKVESKSPLKMQKVCNIIGVAITFGRVCKVLEDNVVFFGDREKWVRGK